MVKRVVQAKPNSDFTVYVYFADGKIRLFDMKPFLGQGVFKAISDLDQFIDKCTVLNGTLAWDLSGHFDSRSCIDIDPETIYLTGQPVIVDPLEQDIA